MKKWNKQILAAICLLLLWGSLSGFISGSQNKVSLVYESGQWAGKTAGSYSGALSNQIPSGSGTAAYTYGGTYTGDFWNGHPSGSGTYIFASGKSVSGCFSWSSGSNYVMEAPLQGNSPHYNGTDMVYVGMMKGGEPCGFGTLDFLDGGTFYGEFLDGTVKGMGVYVYREADPTTEVSGCDWSMVNRASSSLGGRWYSGLLCGGIWQGYGMLCYNYSYYIGEVKDWYCHGHGTYWTWSQSGDPSGSLTRKDYGHYVSGHMYYACSHGSKDDGSTPTPSPAPTPTSPDSKTLTECRNCLGSGDCPRCGGSGRRDCPSSRCFGGVCTKCGGVGHYYIGTKKRYCDCTSGRCNTCHGKGDLKCGYCDGNGKCPTCKGAMFKWY